jgi:hypothetical protein
MREPGLTWIIDRRYLRVVRYSHCLLIPTWAVPVRLKGDMHLPSLLQVRMILSSSFHTSHPRMWQSGSLSSYPSLSGLCDSLPLFGPFTCPTKHHFCRIHHWPLTAFEYWDFNLPNAIPNTIAMNVLYTDHAPTGVQAILVPSLLVGLWWSEAGIFSPQRFSASLLHLDCLCLYPWSETKCETSFHVYAGRLKLTLTFT